MNSIELSNTLRTLQVKSLPAQQREHHFGSCRNVHRVPPLSRPLPILGALPRSSSPQFPDKINVETSRHSSSIYSTANENPQNVTLIRPQPQRRTTDAPRTQPSSTGPADPKLVSITRELLQTKNIEQVDQVLQRNNVSVSQFRRLLTYLDRQDAVDIAFNACCCIHKRYFSNLSSDKNNSAVLLWTKVMKMYSRRSAAEGLRVYNVAIDFGVRPDRVAYNTAILSAGNSLNWSKVMEIREDMKRTGCNPDAFTFSSLLTACQSTGNWKQALQFFEEMEDSFGIAPNVVHYTTLMTTLQRAGQWEESISTFQKMETAGVSADVVSYNAAITACARGGDWERAWSVFAAMRRAGVEPTTVSYNALISACEKSGQAERAVEVFRSMERRGHTPNTVTYNTLISACGKAGKLDEALALHDQMLDRGHQEDAFTLTALLTSCERSANWKKAVEFFQTLQSRGVKPNTVAFNQLIAVLGSAQQWRLALEAAEAMAVLSVPMDIVTYGSLISALERGGKWRQALDVYDRLVEDTELKPNVYIFASVLNACERGRKWERATELFQAMQEAGDDIPLSTLGVLARRALYASPALLSRMPGPLVTAAQAVVETGRAARQWIDRSKQRQQVQENNHKTNHKNNNASPSYDDEAE